METIVIAGGSGFIGSGLKKQLEEAGHRVWILSRKQSKQQSNHVFLWDPVFKTIDEQVIHEATVLINLCGAGIGDKRWSNKRKQELIDSRVETTRFLFEAFRHAPHLKQVVNASGAVAFGFNHPEKIYSETDPLGIDFIGRLTTQWEQAADLFQEICTVCKIRIPIVLSINGGALPRLLAPIKYGFGAILGKGNQAIPWIHEQDLHNLFLWVIEHRKGGTFIAAAGNTTNEELTKLLAQTIHRKLWLPPVPAFALKILFGEMSELLLKGNNVSNKRIVNEGFSFQFTDLNSTIRCIFDKTKNPSS